MSQLSDRKFSFALRRSGGRPVVDARTVKWSWYAAGLTASLQALFIVRALLRPHRQPASRVAWVAIIGALPIGGILAYLSLVKPS